MLNLLMENVWPHAIAYNFSASTVDTLMIIASSGGVKPSGWERNSRIGQTHALLFSFIHSFIHSYIFSFQINVSVPGSFNG